MDESWREQAACYNHPVLDAEAWFEVINGSLRDRGAEAMMVCRRSCPVMQTCRDQYQGVEAIAGGGWFDGKGNFREPRDELMDVFQAAAYLGISATKVRRLMGKYIPIDSYSHGRAWFRFSDVVAMGRCFEPLHGSTDAHRLHLLRGETPCRECRAMVMTENSNDFTDSGVR